MVDRALLQTRLDEAETALHQLLVGKASVSLSYQGESVTFTAADEARLRAYIAQLKAELGLTTRPRAAARRVIFG